MLVLPLTYRQELCAASTLKALHDNQESQRAHSSRGSAWSDYKPKPVASEDQTSFSPKDGIHGTKM